jgi:hypothetical protein
MQRLRAITLWQPWASLMALDKKRFETRSWPTREWGVVLIHAAKQVPPAYRDSVESALQRIEFRQALSGPGRDFRRLADMPQGCVLAIARLVGCRPANAATRAFVDAARGADELAFGDYTDGRYVHAYEDIIALPEPVPARGAQQFWEVDEPTRDAVSLQFVGAIDRLPPDYIRALARRGGLAPRDETEPKRLY